MIRVPDGRPCGCGLLGCWEQYASGRALVTEARQRAARSPEEARLLLELGDGRPESITGPMVTMGANAASRRVMEKCGLRFQGELPMAGTVVAWYAIDRADWQTELAATEPCDGSAVTFCATVRGKQVRLIRAVRRWARVRRCPPSIRRPGGRPRRRRPP
jgi:ROK family protein